VSHRLALRVLLALAVVLTGAAPFVAASTQPDPVVPLGESTFRWEAAQHGYDIERDELAVTATARLTDDGSAEWTVRHRVRNETVTRAWREDPDELDAVVTATLDDHDGSGQVETPTNVSWTFEGDTLVVTLTDPNAVERGYGDQWVVEYLRVGHDGGVELSADRLRLVGPAGSTVTHTASGSVDGRTVLLTEPYPEEGPVVFGTAGTGAVTGEVAAVLSNDRLGDVLAAGVGFPLVTAGLLLGAVAVVGSAVARRLDSDGLSVLAVGTLGVLAVVYGLDAAREGRQGTFSVFVGIGVTAVLAAYAARSATDGARAVRFLPAVVALVVVATTVGATASSLDRLALPLVFTLALVPRFGYRSRYGLRQAVTSGAVVLVGAALTLLTFVWPHLERGLGFGLVLVLFGLVVFGVLAFPLFVTGRLVESENSKRLTGPRAEYGT
jgi:hypothetical protein